MSSREFNTKTLGITQETQIISIMDTTIINDPAYSWCLKQFGDNNIFFKGLFWLDKQYYKNENACQKLDEIFCPPELKITEVESLINQLEGHFSFIIDTPKFSVAVVDRIRSYPIFYHKNKKEIVISNSAKRLKNENELMEKDLLSLLEFQMSGYVTGKQTLFRNLYQLQAGEFLFYKKYQSAAETFRYYRYWRENIDENSDEELLEELNRVIQKTFSCMVETLQGQPVWIPISGGLDSRLILAMLLELRYDNITTFSYGVPGVWEINRAKAIANYLKLKWHYVPYRPRQIKKIFDTEEIRSYFDFAAGFSSVPALSGFYALWILRNKGLIPEDAIFINGQSGDFLDGGHIPKIPNCYKITTEALIEALIEKHFSLWVNLKTKSNIKAITRKIYDLLQITPGSELLDDEFTRYYEMYECQERQSKYVVNGQRMYDWYGYEWRLPLWNDGLMAFWLNVDWKTKFKRKLNKKYLAKFDPGGVFNKRWPPAYSYAPLPIKILNKVFHIAGRLNKKIIPELLYQNYSKYFMTYSYLYPQKSYLEYLKDSKWHRSPISYFSKIFAERL